MGGLSLVPPYTVDVESEDKAAEKTRKGNILFILLSYNIRKANNKCIYMYI